jgi:hypothetical protein
MKTTLQMGLGLIGGIGLGAGVLYVFDPRRGDHRRAWMRCTVARVLKKVGGMASSGGCTLGHRARPQVADGMPHPMEMAERSRRDIVSGRRSRICSVFSKGKISLWVKIPYTLFLCVLVPIYVGQYGPANFLWFSDIALIVALPVLWRENELLASTQAVSVVLLESLWVVDFLLGVVGGKSPLGLAAYMFDPGLSLFVRALSLFHLVLPLLLLWLVYRLGYDPRAWGAQTTVAWVVLPLCYFLTDPAANINWVCGPGARPQTWLPAPLYFLAVMLVFPFGIYLPTHWLLRRWFGRRPALLEHDQCQRKQPSQPQSSDPVLPGSERQPC